MFVRPLLFVHEFIFQQDFGVIPNRSSLNCTQLFPERSV